MNKNIFYFCIYTICEKKREKKNKKIKIKLQALEKETLVHPVDEKINEQMSEVNVNLHCPCLSLLAATHTELSCNMET